MVIDDLKFDAENPCFVVEGGISHGGKLDTLLAMISATAMVGAQAYKTQYRLASEFDHSLQYIAPDVHRNFITTLISLEDHITSREYANRMGLLFGASLFCEEAIDHMDELRPDYLKIGSGESMHLPFVRKVFTKGVELGIPVVVSTGMCDDDEIAELSKLPILLMACVSEYPCSPDQNIAAIDRLIKIIGDGEEFGFSDHSSIGGGGAYAKSRGAVMVERHMKCTDASIDAEVAEDVAGMVSYISGTHGLRTIYEPTWIADKTYPKGELINTDKWIRCGYGVRVTQYIKGRRARIPIERGTPIVNCMLGPPS